MCDPSTNDPKLVEFLFQIDKDLASKTREKGCPHCGGVLHSACYPRKPKGLPISPESKANIRFSFCCSTDGCRRRVTPPSVRFLGRKHYLGAVVLLLSAMFKGQSQRGIQKIEKLLGVSSKTLSRWHTWWQEIFPASRFWQYSKSFLMPPLNSACICQDLVDRFSAQDDRLNLSRLLRFLSPLSCPSAEVEIQAL